MKYKKEDLRCKFVKFYTVVLTQISRTSHYLKIITTMIVLSLSVTPFSLARPSSLRKEGKSAVLDYWQFKVLHSALICFTNPASPNFFTGRAGFVLRTHTAHLPKSAKKTQGNPEYLLHLFKLKLYIGEKCVYCFCLFRLNILCFI